MTALIQANSIAIPLADESVSLVVFSPPYFALRSYRDGGEHYEGQLGSEATPQEFLEALWSVMREVWRVLRPDGSWFVNLGDKRTGSGGGNQSGLLAHRNPAIEVVHDAKVNQFDGPRRYNQAAFGRTKSKMLLPHRFAIGCEDGIADPEGIGWILRQDICWQKLNGLPESMVDRTRDSHEYVFHLTKQGNYFSGMDEIREASAPQNGLAGTFKRPKPSHDLVPGQAATQHRSERNSDDAYHPMGKLPGSVWPLPSEPLIISEAVKKHYDLPDHFAAYPTELVRKIILGWSPSGICTVCDEGRRPVVEKQYRSAPEGYDSKGRWGLKGQDEDTPLPTRMGDGVTATITGYACACTPDDLEGWEHPPTREAIILDPFSGTGTTVGVANTLGRFGVGIDLSWDYLRLSRWRVEQSGHFAKVMDRTNAERQGSLF